MSMAVWSGRTAMRSVLVLFLFCSMAMLQFAPAVAAANKAPVASMTVITPEPASTLGPLDVVFDGSLSKDSDGKINSYSWTFGDGSAAYTRVSNSSHTYKAAGDYTATLIVTDNGGATGRVNVKFHLEGNKAPVAVITATPNGGKAPLQVVWDASGSYDPNLGDAVLARDCDWLFSDGDVVTGTATVTKSYTTPGTYSAKLTVHDKWGVTNTTTYSITVTDGNLPPVAAVKVMLPPPPTGFMIGPLCPFFDASASYDPDGTIVNWTYDYGDGFVDNFPNSNQSLHNYNAAGDYVITVTVTDNKGATGSVSVPFHLPGNTPPVAVITATPSSGTAPATIRFDANASYDPDTAVGDSVSLADAQWVFSDGTTATGPVVDKTFANPGTYTAQLTVHDAWSAPWTGVTTVTKSVTVAAPISFRITSLTITSVKSGSTRTVTAVARANDTTGKVVVNAVVTGNFTGVVTTNGVSGSTGADGKVSLKGTTTKAGTATFTITGVVAPAGYTFNSAGSVTTASYKVQ